MRGVCSGRFMRVPIVPIMPIMPIVPIMPLMPLMPLFLTMLPVPFVCPVVVVLLLFLRLRALFGLVACSLRLCLPRNTDAMRQVNLISDPEPGRLRRGGPNHNLKVVLEEPALL